MYLDHEHLPLLFHDTAQCSTWFHKMLGNRHINLVGNFGAAAPGDMPQATFPGVLKTCGSPKNH